MHSERLRERKLLTHKNSIKWVKCCGAVAFFKPKGEQLLALFFFTYLLIYPMLVL